MEIATYLKSWKIIPSNVIFGKSGGTFYVTIPEAQTCVHVRLIDATARICPYHLVPWPGIEPGSVSRVAPPQGT